MHVKKELSLVLPCLDEEKTIGICIKKAKDVFRKHNIDGEIIVADNGSRDNSRKVASSLGAKVIRAAKKGYGSAYLKGFSAAKGKIIVMADSDNTYDLREMPKLIKHLDDSDIVIGNRFNKMRKGAMPWFRRHLGNPGLTWVLNYLFRLKLSDTHSGFRAFRREILDKVRLNSSGMEFASEFIIKAARAGFSIKEISIAYYPREGESKLNPLRDGWRHLQLMLMSALRNPNMKR